MNLYLVGAEARYTQSRNSSRSRRMGKAKKEKSRSKTPSYPASPNKASSVLATTPPSNTHGNASRLSARFSWHSTASSSSNVSSPQTANSSFLLASPSSSFTLSPSPASRATNSTVEGQSINVTSAQKSSNKSSWTGFKKVKTVLKTSTGAFGPLRSVVDGMDELIRIFEVSHTSNFAHTIAS